jgi:hypothetical protein
VAGKSREPGPGKGPSHPGQPEINRFLADSTISMASQKNPENKNQKNNILKLLKDFSKRFPKTGFLLDRRFGFV